MVLALTLALLLLFPSLPSLSLSFTLHALEEDETQVPLPYERDEFPEWAWDLRRGEIIAFGAFPVAMILSGISLQLGRFAVASIQEGRFSQENAPFFLSTRTGPRFDEGERVGLLISAGIISVGVAVADYLLGRREQRNR